MSNDISKTLGRFQLSFILFIFLNIENLLKKGLPETPLSEQKDRKRKEAKEGYEFIEVPALA